MESNSAATASSWFYPALGLAFIVLKLTEVITWSWWWVLLPLYGPAVIALIVIVIALIFARDRF